MNTLIQYLQTEWTGWGQTALFLGGAAIVWVLSRAQSIGEIRKLQAERAAMGVDQFEKLIAFDVKQRGIIDRLYAQLQVLLEAVQRQDIIAAKTAREATQKLFLLEYIGAYFHYANVGRWVFPEVRKELVDDEILPFLKTSATLLESLNKPSVLALTQQSPLIVSDNDFNFAFRFVRKNTRFWEFERKRKLRELEGRLLKQAT
jgi:hypothetical protein